MVYGFCTKNTHAHTAGTRRRGMKKQKQKIARTHTDTHTYTQRTTRRTPAIFRRHSWSSASRVYPRASWIQRLPLAGSGGYRHSSSRMCRGGYYCGLIPPPPPAHRRISRNDPEHLSMSAHPPRRRSPAMTPNICLCLPTSKQTQNAS